MSQNILNKFKSHALLIATYFSIIVLLGGGLVAAIISICDFAGYDFMKWKSIPALGLLLVSIIAISIAFERISILTNVEARLEDIKSRLASQQSQGSYIHLKSIEQAQDLACSLVADSQRRLRSITVPETIINRQLTNRWALKLIEHLKNSIKVHRPVYYDVIMVVKDRASAQNQPLKLVVSELETSYRSASVDQVISRKYFVSSMTINVLIFDDKHAIFAYPLYRGTQMAQAGFAILDQPNLVRELCEWFDNHILSESFDSLE